MLKKQTELNQSNLLKHSFQPEKHRLHRCQLLQHVPIGKSVDDHQFVIFYQTALSRWLHAHLSAYLMTSRSIPWTGKGFAVRRILWPGEKCQRRIKSSKLHSAFHQHVHMNRISISLAIRSSFVPCLKTNSCPERKFLSTCLTNESAIASKLNQVIHS